MCYPCVNCGKCGAEPIRGKVRCPKCGTELSPEHPVCEKCGYSFPLPPGVKSASSSKK